MKTFFGLDIGSGSIKASWIKKEKEKLRLLALGEAPTPVGVTEIASEQIRLAETVKKLVADLEIRTKLVAVALPETKVISRILVFPPMKEEEVYKAIFYEAETFIPYPLEEVQIDYQIIESSSAQILVFVAGAPKKIIQQYEDLIQKAGLIPMALETTATALGRTFGNTSPQAMMVLDLGSKSSTMVVTKRGFVFFTRTIPIGGEAFTRAISISLGMETFKAEEYKKTYGFQVGKWEDKIRKALGEVFERLGEEIRKGMLSFKEEWREDVKFLVVCGGGASLPGLTDELLKVLGVEVQIGQPLAGIETEGAKIMIGEQEGLSRFAVAVGLARREE